MNIERFEELESEIMAIAKRVAVISVNWVTEELNITEQEALEALEILTHRGDLRGRNHSGWYTVRRQPLQRAHSLRSRIK